MQPFRAITRQPFGTHGLLQLMGQLILIIANDNNLHYHFCHESPTPIYRKQAAFCGIPGKLQPAWTGTVAVGKLVGHHTAGDPAQAGQPAGHDPGCAQRACAFCCGSGDTAKAKQANAGSKSRHTPACGYCRHQAGSAAHRTFICGTKPVGVPGGNKQPCSGNRHCTSRGDTSGTGTTGTGALVPRRLSE